MKSIRSIAFLILSAILASAGLLYLGAPNSHAADSPPSKKQPVHLTATERQAELQKVLASLHASLDKQTGVYAEEMYKGLLGTHLVVETGLDPNNHGTTLIKTDIKSGDKIESWLFMVPTEFASQIKSIQLTHVHGHGIYAQPYDAKGQVIPNVGYYEFPYAGPVFENYKAMTASTGIAKPAKPLN